MNLILKILIKFAILMGKLEAEIFVLKFKIKYPHQQELI